VDIILSKLYGVQDAYMAGLTGIDTHGEHLTCFPANSPLFLSDVPNSHQKPPVLAEPLATGDASRTIPFFVKIESGPI
jgi:hypothetical protein